MDPARPASKPVVFTGRVAANRALCREHLRLSLTIPSFPEARPGQFVHIGGHVACRPRPGQPRANQAETSPVPVPFLRRAFSIAGLRAEPDAAEVDLIYRLVGTGTRWLASLREGDLVDGIGPLGRGFTVPPPGTVAWLVAGGVGLPPLLWMAREAERSGQPTVFFLGARTRDLMALDLTSAGGNTVASELPGLVPVLATDDGSIGRRGSVVDAVEAYAVANQARQTKVIVYTCGPEVMIRAVADFCRGRGIQCQVCLERSMACGIGTCQSCVVAVADASQAQGWRYALCCKEGPVFDAADVLWDR